MCKITVSYWLAFYAFSSDLVLEPSRVEEKEEEIGGEGGGE